MQKREQQNRSSSDALPPDFALVEPITYRRDLLLPQEADSEEEILLKRFAIVLGLAVNELKDIDWGHHQLTKRGKPKQKKHLGQYYGMLGTFARLTAGIIVELGKAIVAAQHLGVFDCKTFQAALAKLTPTSRRTWDATVFSLTQRADSDSAEKKGAPFKDPVQTLMTFARNSTFHFGHEEKFKPLAKGYELKFTASQGEFGSDYLYVSLGNTLEQTRFYFADAAIATLIQQKTESLRVTPKRIHKLASDLHNALRYLLEALLKEFDACQKRESPA